jgi:hypothetical protein
VSQGLKPLALRLRPFGTPSFVGRNGNGAEGRIAAGLGNHEQARQLLTQVRQRFLNQGNAFDAVLAALDLSLSHLKEGKTAEVRELADEMVTVFSALEVAREPMAALLLFQEAAHRDAATAELARKVAATLSRSLMTDR